MPLELRRPASAILRLVLALAAILIHGFLAAEIKPSLAPASYPRPVRIFFSSDDPDAVLSYRFEGARNFRLLENALLLEALPGEERGYLIYLEARSVSGGLETASFLYKIDRRAPPVPRTSVEPGFVLPGSSIELSSAGAARILYSLYPSLPEAQEYSGPIRLPDYSSGIIRYSLSAIALDELGNPSQPFVGDFISLPKGYSPAKDFKAQGGRSTQTGSASLIQASPAMQGSVEEHSLGFVLRFKHPQALSFRYSLRDSSPEAGVDPESLPELDANLGEALLDIRAPSGWVGQLFLDAFARLPEGRYIKANESLKLTFKEGASAIPLSSIGAKLLPAASARGAWLIADSTRSSLRYQVDSQEPREYLFPVFIAAAPGAERLRVSYSTLQVDGSRSKESLLEIQLGPDPGRPELDGVPESGVSASSIIVSPGPAAKVLRYEVANGDALPKAVGADSPLLESNSGFHSAPGATISYRFRLRSFSDASPTAAGSDEAFVQFTVDRTPPEPPRIQENRGIAGAPNKFFGFAAGSDEVYYRVSRNGKLQGAYSRFRSPIYLEADPSGPVSYTVEAYAVDLAGNRSSEARFDNISIDATAVYLSGSGSDENDGSPSSPLASLEAALRVATITARPRIKVQGRPKPSGDIVIEDEILIQGGFSGLEWTPDASAQAKLSIRSITQKRGRLTVEDLELSGNPAKGRAFLSLASSSALFRRSVLKLESQAEEAIELSREAHLEFVDSSASFSAAGRFTAIDSSSSTIRITRSSLSLSGADIGTLLSLSKGQVKADQSFLSCDSRQSSATMSLGDAVYDFSNCLIESKAAKGFVACVYARDSSGSIDTSLLRSSQSSETVLFDISGGSLKLSHATGYVEGNPRSAYAFRLATGALEVSNSAFAVFSAKAEGALFDGLPDPKGIQYLCAAGFKRISKRQGAEAFLARILIAEPQRLFTIDQKGLPLLLPDSPLIDAGMVPDGVGSQDWYGNPRPSAHGKGLPDIGAVEYQ